MTRHRSLLGLVIDRLREGCTVVFGGWLSNSVDQGQLGRCFATLGLSWERGSYQRETVKLNRDAVDPQLASLLPATYSQKALYIMNVQRSAAWYVDEGSYKQEASVVFTKFGMGRLGYFGDVNGETPTHAVVLGMCGLLD